MTLEVNRLFAEESITQDRSYALEQAIGYNIDYDPTQMH